eukprot:CAMPEP_0174301304 /NCGR_PEP_ID=MMETSP0809-20121228/58975_1 /TAXON_ID=73025 ORGANISM="Eutreptiella gymnastica-like, Strain CCMP1594" /NCGR_SAMPLE_ID=MMETSP0809 /ASSEMBLY_ACC=CAM_ASM_000658 /LENGTH=112 /DNA_ID=CAMNT_0015407039 /DNA_START=336 /DNA_END=674 /DNA_ORIENTATION=+
MEANLNGTAFSATSQPKIGRGGGSGDAHARAAAKKKALWAITIFLGSVTHVEGLYNINLLRSPNSTIRYNIRGMGCGMTNTPQHKVTESDGATCGTPAQVRVLAEKMQTEGQ